ncbi:MULTISPECIES: aldehyde dehydrogenase family protein [Sphingobium]|uniref:Aldehyde dehydrogenase n=1 Tax=Sphingobium fuliginis (strain ATCC 27551) TaxID=336203 RepID=A0ABQ1EVG4_SPHSA|nr:MULTISPECIES: aldehyde dehydrogenase family protein [Sphingobium]AJR26518.1 betaine-aldehyde dehydrogenase [Sphingobium sp. YBL2]RYL99031.1 aldehyde dehydrogenase family protein [Sphingobium fuliginis]UXC92592.1 aldehyde dehydrogenase family protein [Sphingobium sp. RSMS]GFZ87918.1 aldehyde dehydrogenase [Sphingobium fuliginis]
MIETRRPTFIDGKPKKLLIDGRPVDALSGETFQSFSPSTGELVAELALAGAEDVDRAVRAARAAFEGPWSRFKPAERQAVLLKLADLVDAEFDDLALLDCIEMGRPITAARGLRGMLQRSLRHFAGAATAIHGETLSNSFPVDLLSYTLREPVGVVGAIIPWNGPLFSAAWKVGPVLATGCAIVLKPAEDASLSPLRFGELCLEAGVPPGVVNVVTGAGETGGALSAHPDVDKIAFTGSCETGQRIIAASAGTVKKVTMELGGKSPNIIFADADLDMATPAAAMGVFNNSGQVCAAGTRLFVERPVYEDMVQRIAAFAKALKIGPSLDTDTQIGPLVSARQYARVSSYLELGPMEGARLVTGGERVTGGAFDKGHWVAPTIFADVKDEMRIAREEIFGPVSCIMPFDDFDEVIARANATRFGLAGGVWTKDIGKAMTAVKRIRAGSIWVNHYFAMDPSVPFGGYKMSGFGREGGAEHIDAYLQTKGVWIRT